MTFRSVEVPEGAAFDLEDQSAPMLQWLPVADLVVDDTYQRPLHRQNWNAIRKIARDFRWSRFTPVLAAPVEGGKFAIIDGQHRTHAAALCGIEAVPAQVVHMTQGEQASAFAWVNGNVTAITVFHVYKAALAAKEGWAIQCRDSVAAAGCALMPYNKSANQKEAGEVYAIALIREYVENDMGAHVTRCLSAIRATDGDEPEFYTNLVLRPFFAATMERLEFRDVDLEAFLNEVSLVDVSDRVDMMRKQEAYRRQSKFVLMKASISALLSKFLRDQSGDVLEAAE